MQRDLAPKSLVLLGLGVFLTGNAAAQVSAGVQSNWAHDATLGLGVHVAFDLGGLVKGLETVASYDHFFPAVRHGANTRYRELNANLAYRVKPTDGRLAPYFGTGLNVSFQTTSVHVLDINASGSETLSGINLLAGLMLDLGRFKPFLEGRAKVAAGTQYVASVGVRF